MMMLSEIAKAMDGRMLGADVLCESVGSDSRNIAKNQLFVGIKGEKFDGNTYALEAIKQGAAAALVNDADTPARPAVVVADTRLALGGLAKYWRNKFNVSLVAVTGSNGKTTVKEMIAAILNAAGMNAAGIRSVLATQGNLNNDIGMPMTLLKLRQEHAYAVIEMGMSHEGEIRYLTNLAQPNVAVVNNAGTAHIGEVGSREGIARAKGEIFEGLGDNGIAIINADDDFADYWCGLNKNRKVLTFGLDKKADISAALQANIHAASSPIILKTPIGEVAIELQMPGVHNVRNALAAAAVAIALNIPLQAIQQGLSQFGGVKGRLQRKLGLGGAQLIDDTYNANPDSMKAALDVLSMQSGRKIFVMGDMGELGMDSAKMHAEIGAYAKQKGVDVLLALGENSAHAVHAFGANATHYASLDALLDAASGLMKKDVTVLVKGSRFMQMERVVKKIIANEMVEKKSQLEKSQCC